MTYISKVVYALIIFLSIYVGVNDCMLVTCEDHFDCRQNVQQVGCSFREIPQCINSICKCMKG
ncbi:putative Late nodulin [Medicago truncatula]|uniref:Nodule Cysteine-Rich (NCR) secreted peptide n=1 Tax=Medicago truncatula TaxID=3880 RepID=A7KH73_MEDTR|nr:nodule-specific cysteine-rich peptide 54 [Medicago truncatula]AES60271.1 Nodule Cysteine-Rich (NCR) secreted peptide [Medicago truncatula]AFK44816.1 unknown [Medicago truncatula]RHN78592.1 putative Late nodulin [Medicago truncatula]